MDYFQQGIKEITLNNTSAAYKMFLLAVQQDCNHAKAWLMLGTALRQEKKYSLAITCLKKSVDLEPNSSINYFELGETYRLNKQWNLAQYHLETAIQLDESNSSAWHYLASILVTTGQVDRADYAIERAIKLNPSYNYFHWLKTLMLLSKGDYNFGFQRYEMRKTLPDRGEMANIPEYNGQDLTGKVLFIIREQGFGDVIQFSRFLTLIPPEINFVVGLQKDLVSLYQTSFPNITFCYWNAVPSNASYFMQIASLINFVDWGRTPSSVPHPAKLKSNKSIVIPKSIGTKKVGICFFGSIYHQNNNFRSINIDTFYENLTDTSIELYSLQLGLQEYDSKKPKGTQKDPVYIGKMGLMHDLSPLIHDFNDTAAILLQLDALVSIDTSIVHLAGSLNIPTKMIISYYNVDWRWGHKSTTTCWYPSVTLYRQEHEDQSWDIILQQVKRDILAS